MGCNFWTTIAVWTFLYQVLGADQRLFQDLGLNALPDVTKINISQVEYTRMMNSYLDSRLQHSTDANAIPEFVTFNMETTKDYNINNHYNRIYNNYYNNKRLRFPIEPNSHNKEILVDSAQLRILAPPVVEASTQPSVKVKIYQVLGTRRRKLLEEKNLYLSANLTKWCDFDVTSAVQSWFSGEKNLGLELVCEDCDNLHPIEGAISVLIYPEQRRFKRAASPYQPLRRTDCRESRKGSKRKCCRHNMTVTFADLRFPEMGSIIQPKNYEAGFCKGQCPPNYNHATNHSRIQSLIHQMDRKVAKRLNRRAVPKACCAPSKLKPLEILRVNPDDTTKLIVEKWDNMEVIECACS